jgi:hypothetical protein
MREETMNCNSDKPDRYTNKEKERNAKGKNVDCDGFKNSYFL